MSLFKVGDKVILNKDAPDVTLNFFNYLDKVGVIMSLSEGGNYTGRVSFEPLDTLGGLFFERELLHFAEEMTEEELDSLL